MLPYAFSIFTGAFLLFLVQPLIGKYILPWFGGSPGVWTTCLLFFQTLLLGGYAYAHFTSTRLRPRTQAIVHGALLVLSLAWLPIIPSAGWKPVTAGDPTWQILLLLAACLGLPYFVLSATGPLLQHWFSRTHAGVSPYRLYALSNAGSLLALLGYPFVVEPAFSRQTQAMLWSAGLVVFVGLCGYCAWQMARRAGLAGAEGMQPGAAHAAGAGETDAALPTAADKFLWLALPALASVLLLATTNKLCQEVAVVPFLWVLPLALYLLSFILSFDHPRWYSRGVFSALLVVSGAVVWSLLHTGAKVSLPRQVIGYASTLFVACMVCHGELYRLKPSPRHLTQFYLFIAAGGALGGLVVAVVAPLVFQEYIEFQFGWWGVAYLAGLICLLYKSRAMAVGSGVGALVALVVLPALQTSSSDGGVGRWAVAFFTQAKVFYGEHWQELGVLFVIFAVCMREGWRPVGRHWQLRMGAWPLMLSVVFGVALVIQVRSEGRSAVMAARNFYGTLKIYEYYESEPRAHHYVLTHGATTHGLQFTRLPQAMWPTTYYGRESGVGLAIALSPRHSARRLGVVGLGTGSLATYGEPGDTVRFYEINPAVEQLARTRFTYLAQSPAHVEVVIGDARLSMERELERSGEEPFDVLALDAFSSDAIPVHLLTKEAFAVYLARVRPDGVIAVHISNRYLNLRPVVEALARHFGRKAVTISHQAGDDWWLSGSTWVLVTNNEAVLQSPTVDASSEASVESAPADALWTDDHASLMGVLK